MSRRSPARRSLLRAAMYVYCANIVACTGNAPPVRTDARVNADASANANADANANANANANADAGAGANADANVSADADANVSADAIGGGDAGLRVDVASLGARLFEDDATALFKIACPESAPDDARVSCLFSRRFSHDAEAARLARELFTSFDVAAGVAKAHTIDGGFRGTISLVPAPPEGADKKHLAWVLASYKDFAVFFAALEERAHKKVPYRVNHVAFRFMRSVGRTTPSAYANDWTVSYNVQGSLLKSVDSVRETLFHEIFHLNDQEHGDWSPRALSDVFDPIVKKCGTNMACLAPYAPNDTTVRGGTYYAFQPNNGLAVREYAAELSVRYLKEHTAVIHGSTGKKPWKCTNDENRKAWERVRDEFFAGVDLTPAC